MSRLCILSLGLLLSTAPSLAQTADLERNLVQSSDVPSLKVAGDLRVEEVLREPTIANPLYINFDERGRMWVVQYRQYPWPAGLKLISRDAVWRNVYDPPAPPPPPFTGENEKFRGKDMITIHESTRGDGVFDKTSVFLEGLNLATAALKGRGGVFVLNPPYLLFYRCRENEDRPESLTPEVLLSGFGIEDTHSIANSLRWGPDGWIYGAQGSTVSGSVVRHGADGKPIPGEKPVHTMGQNIWRYHPETRRFEIFAEGGGNTFGVVFDSKGRLYSGHNGGDTRGFHYIQGGYYLKGFDKHGSLSNPYTFGYIRNMEHEKVDRFTHTFLIYEAQTLPEDYWGKLIGIAPHRHYVVSSEINPLGSTFRTHDVAKILVAGKNKGDDWFTPVDVQVGPDGAVYIADWYSVQPSHLRASVGETDSDTGRIYRLQPHRQVTRAVNLLQWSNAELVRLYLRDANPWFRWQVLRLLGDRKDASLRQSLSDMLHKEKENGFGLECLWALNLCGGFDDAEALRAMDHPDPFVRLWAVRLLGDNNQASTDVVAKMVKMAVSEGNAEARSQLACTAKRLPSGQAFPILINLLKHSEDAADQHIPRMLWWALEAHANDRDAAVEMFENREVWASKLRPEGRTLSENLMQRWAMAGSQQDLLACARLFKLSPDQESSRRMLAAFERAFEGRPVPPLPDALAEALASAGGRFSLLLGVRQHDAPATEAALKLIGDASANKTDRVQLIRAIGDMRAAAEKSIPLLIRMVRDDKSDEIRVAALGALSKFDDASIGAAVVDAYATLPSAAKSAAQSLLASRVEWARQLMNAIDSGKIKARSLQSDTVEKLKLAQDPEIAKLIGQHFPEVPGTAAALEQKIGRLKGIIRKGGGQPLVGRQLFHEKAGCGACHTVFDKGGHIGPDLTPYDRANLDSMLLAIVNPSAEVREGFETYIVHTKDGRTLDGFKVDDDGKILVLRGTDGQNNVVPVEQIKSKRIAPRSLMPEGLLDSLSEQELRDLFAFLSSTEPPK